MLQGEKIPDLNSLTAEVESLKQRVNSLEDQLRSITSSALSPAVGPGEAARVVPEKKVHPPRIPWQKRLSEEFIGGKLLNRVGALIVVIAVAYFLKWSFDNDIIGELGRCVLGLAGGVVLMAGGHIYFKKGYAIFSQGIIGAGIAIIYLSTYAAVNYYHLINPYLAFASMFLTAIAAGVIAAIDDMPGTASLATIGGFLVPFLMGAHTGKIIPLLTYILVLNLGVLFLAYYRQWFFLDFLALAGSLIVSIVAYNLEWHVWPGQVFLAAFLILFIIVAALYNHRTRSDNPWLLLASGLAFSIFTFYNLYTYMEHWLGLVSLGLATIYLGTYFVIRLRRFNTDFFAYTVLVIAGVLSTLTWPAQLQGVYNQMAWLAVAAATLYFSWFNRNLPAYITALTVLILTLFSVGTEYHPRPLFNQTSLILWLSTLDWAGALWIAVKNYPRRKWLTGIIALIVTAIIFFLLDYDINNAIYYYQANQSFSFLIPISWALLSSLVLWLGVRRDHAGVRLFALSLYGVVILRTIFYDLRQLDIVFKIMMLFVIGLIALAISFFYQKRIRGDEEQ